jgi:hypothetical protein
VIAAIAFISLGISAVFLYVLFTIMMAGEINRKRQDDLASYFALTPAMALRIFREYRRLYPRGKLHIYALVFFGLGVGGVVFMCVYLNSIR